MDQVQIVFLAYILVFAVILICNFAYIMYEKISEKNQKKENIDNGR